MNHRYKNYLPVLLILYLLAGIFLLPYFRYYIQADTLQYLSISTKYANGSFYDAVNSYWSPLLCWLIALCIKIGMEPLHAMNLLLLLCGMISLIGIYKLLYKENSIYFFLIYLSLTVGILGFALLEKTSDLLFMTISIWYLVILTTGKWFFQNKYSFIVIGSLGTILYVAKYPGFFIFFLSFSVYNLYHLLKKNYALKHISIQYVKTILVFLALSSVWIAIISNKEGKFTISSTMKFNFNLIGPIVNPNVFATMIFPLNETGLFPPATSTSLCAWESPGNIKYGEWQLLSSKKNILHYIKVVTRNVLSVQSFYFGKDHGTALVLLICCLFFVSKKKLQYIFLKNLLLLLMVLSFTLPYLLVLVEERYVWINNILLAVIATHSIKAYLHLKRVLIGIFTIVYCIAMMDAPIDSFIHRDYVYKFNAVFQNKNDLIKYINGNIASIKFFSKIKNEDYELSSYVSYVSSKPYYGMVKRNTPKDQLIKEFRKYNISYVLSWNQESRLSADLYNEKRYFEGGLWVYKLNKFK